MGHTSVSPRRGGTPSMMHPTPLPVDCGSLCNSVGLAERGPLMGRPHIQTAVLSMHARRQHGPYSGTRRRSSRGKRTRSSTSANCVAGVRTCVGSAVREGDFTRTRSEGRVRAPASRHPSIVPMQAASSQEPRRARTARTAEPASARRYDSLASSAQPASVDLIELLTC
jgi:hypothetical protein